MRESFYVQWHITNRCHLRCGHCYQDDFTGDADLDGKGLRRIATELLKTAGQWDKTACIHLTGGEPLLRGELFSLLGFLEKSTSVEELGIITNGLLLDREMIGRLAGYRRLKTIKISLDGARPETHDAIRFAGCFEKVLRNVEGLQQWDRFETILMFTVMKKNVQEVEPLIHLCQDLGIDGLMLERFIPIGQGRKAIDEVLDKEDWKSLIDMLSQVFSLEKDEPWLLPYQAFQIRFQKGEESELLGAPCVIGSDGLCIMPDGRVFPCRRFPIPIGNLLQESLSTIWETSEILRLLRDKSTLKGRCGSCELQGCRGCRSLALSLTGDYLAEDPHCWHQP